MPRKQPSARYVAGGGLLDRRGLLQATALLTTSLLGSGSARSESPRPAWMATPGAPMSAYGAPSPHEEVRREVIAEYPGITPGAGVSFTPLHRLRGRLTPNGLHFERHHSGVPAIDPDAHRLVLHGLVERPLAFSMDRLLRYPQISQIAFIECSGNSFWNTLDEPRDFSAGKLHGLLSCSEWTGVPLGLLLEEAGVKKGARWGLAEGADAAAMVRSIPLEKLRDDAIVALFQNGERLRPEQGYPLRLLLPGYEGNTSVKWLRQLKLTESPVQSRDETSKYADLLPDGQSLQFTLEMGVKSLITTPSGGMRLPAPGTFSVEGVAWSGSGRIREVEVSADGGASWARASLDEPVESKSLCRFRIPWEWRGGSQQLSSRATDEKGNTQPSRDSWLSGYAPGQIYHYNAIQSWQIEADGQVRNVYA